MDKYCLTCKKKLEFCKGVEPWNTDHMICPVCNGTYNIDELNKCECKYGHADGKCRWPTLEGRLNQTFTTRKQALLQLYECYKMGGVSMSEKVLKEVEKYIEQDKKKIKVRKSTKLYCPYNGCFMPNGAAMPTQRTCPTCGNTEMDTHSKYCKKCHRCPRCNRIIKKFYKPV